MEDAKQNHMDNLRMTRRQAVGYAQAHTLACHWPSSYTGKTSPDRVAIKAELVAGISEERWRFDFWGGEGKHWG